MAVECQIARGRDAAGRHSPLGLHINRARALQRIQLKRPTAGHRHIGPRPLVALGQGQQTCEHIVWCGQRGHLLRACVGGEGAGAAHVDTRARGLRHPTRQRGAVEIACDVHRAQTQCRRTAQAQVVRGRTVHDAGKVQGACGRCQGGVCTQCEGVAVGLGACAGHQTAIDHRGAHHIQIAGARDGLVKAHSGCCQRGVAIQAQGLAIALCPCCGDAATINHHTAARHSIDGQASQRRAAPHDAAEGGDATGVHGQCIGAIDGVAKIHAVLACAEHGVAHQRDG